MEEFNLPFKDWDMMLACNTERDSSLEDYSEIWGLAVSCNILAGTSAGPVDLFVFNSCNNVATPFVVMVMSGSWYV